MEEIQGIRLRKKRQNLEIKCFASADHFSLKTSNLGLCPKPTSCPKDAGIPHEIYDKIGLKSPIKRQST